MLSTILGFSAFGLAARFGQLAIQQRPLLSSEFLQSQTRTRLDPNPCSPVLLTFNPRTHTNR